MYIDRFSFLKITSKFTSPLAWKYLSQIARERQWIATRHMLRLWHAMVNRFSFRVPHNFAKFNEWWKWSRPCAIYLSRYPFRDINGFTVKRQSSVRSKRTYKILRQLLNAILIVSIKMSINMIFRYLWWFDMIVTRSI